MLTKERLIVALDFAEEQAVKNLVEKLGDEVVYYKVGMELYYSVGPSILDYLAHKGKKIFLDLKLLDIPNTVAQAMANLAVRPGIDIVNVHASGGPTMMKESADRMRAAAKKAGLTPPKLIAVTLLTSLGEDEWARLNGRLSLREQVVSLAKLTKESGLDGVVASPQEAAAIREACGEDFLIITPGIRPAGSDVGDQVRIATPASALAAGSDYLVVGRPISQAADPALMARQIVSEMEGYQK